MLEIKTQAELDQAIKNKIPEVCVIAKGEFEVNSSLYWIELHVKASLSFEILFKLRGTSRAVLRGTSRAVLWGTSSAVLRETSSAVLRETSSAVLRETSSAVLRETSSAVLRETSSAVASGYVSLSLFGKNTVKMSAKCHAFVHSDGCKITGGKVTKAILKTAQDWCDYYGVKVVKGLARVYKSLHVDFYNPRNRTICYAPGTKPEARDWDGGKQECGYGLHVSPTPRHATQFHAAADAKYVELWVSLKEMAVHFDGEYPQKAKVKKIAKPIIEVDIDGNPIKGK